MRVTRRWGAITAVGLTFAILAVLTQSPLYLGGTLLVAGAHVAGQYALLTDLERVRNTATVSHTFTPSTAIEDTPVEQTATITLPQLPASTITATLTPPTVWDTSPTQTSLDTQTRLSASGHFPLAGRFTTPPITLEATSPFGLYTETIPLGPDAGITVDPSAPRDTAIFSGGDRISIGYGEHPTTRETSGLDPGKIRQYLPGDPTSRIDWNATARLGDPYIREFETNTDRDTLLFVDHRSSLADGPAGRTQLDYLREIGLWFTRHAADLDDPLGLYTIGNAGRTAQTPLQTGSASYRRIEHQLHDLTPTTASTPTRPTHTMASIDLHERARQLDDNSQYTMTLRPYLAHTGTAVERVESDPLFSTVTTTLDRTRGDPWIVILTDDTHRTELHETLRVLRRRDIYVSVFICPNALFTSHGLTDADTAYADYVDFLDYRDRLAGPRTTLYEVGPGDHLETILPRASRTR